MMKNHSLTVFMYHRVLPFEHPEAVTTAQFASQLDWLMRRYAFLTPDEACAFAEDGVLPEKKNRFYAVLSFDDGWVDNRLFAEGVLRERNLSAMLAVSAGTLAPGDVRAEVPEDVLRRGMDESRELAKHGDTLGFLNRGELAEMASSGIWTLEAHGTRHEKTRRGISILADFPSEAFLEDDLSNCMDHLKLITGRTPRAMFWPWGHYTETGAGIAGRLGLNLQFTVSKGTVEPGDSRKVLPRIGVSRNEKKLHKNVFVFRHPALALAHDLFHTEKVKFE